MTSTGRNEAKFAVVAEEGEFIVFAYLITL